MKWLIPTALAGTALAVVLLYKPTAEGEHFVPSVDEVLAAGDYATLEYYYDASTAAYLQGRIDRPEYDALYGAYVQRWYELGG